ncbi:MAG: hypothetical protein ABSA06_05590 [Geobacteraceae bacterium]
MKKNVVPLSGSPSAHIRPPWRWMILYGSETDAESVEFRLIMEALERNEQLFRFCHDETDSVVADEACQSAVNLRHAEFDDWRFLLLCKLPSFAEEVFHDHHEQPGSGS